MTRWNFYGRKQEMELLSRDLELDRPLAERQFNTTLIAGRRRVGKNALLNQTVRRYGDLADLLVVELPEHEGGGHDSLCLLSLLAAIDRCGLHERLKSFSLPPARSGPSYHFGEICRHLIGQGVIVCLDEFHNAERTGIVSSIKQLIDHIALGYIRQPSVPKPPGKLILMGSHQQRIKAMFTQQRALYGRIDTAVKVRPWRLSSIFMMAEEQGLLQQPERFLTLWTAYGGMPHCWERFIIHARHAALRDGLTRSSSDQADRDQDRNWLQAFLQMEHDILLDSELDERFDNQAYIELKPYLRTILLHMARYPRTKLRASDFPVELRSDGQTAADLAMALSELKSNVQLVRNYSLPTDSSSDTDDPVWEIADNAILFQLHVFPELFRTRFVGEIEADPEPSLDTRGAQARMTTLEGVALERLIKDWMRECPLRQWGATNVYTPRNRLRQDEDTNEIDALLQLGDGDTNDILLVVSAKRQAAKQAREMKKESGMPVRLDRLLERMPSLNKRIGGLRRIWTMVSPRFTVEQVHQYEADGVVCIDISAMAGEMRNDWPRLRALVDLKPDVPSRGGGA